MLNIVLIRSYIGLPDKQRKILAALGLKKIRNSVQHADNKAVRGMINKISHLIAVEKTAK